MSYPFASPYAQASPAPAQHAYHSYGRDDGTTPAHLRQDSHASEAEKYGAADDGTAARGRTHATYQDADDDRHAAPLYSKGIWQPDDKRAFARRNVGVKICRSIACVVIWAALIIICIICLFLTFARPPNIGISGVTVPQASDVALTSSGFTLNGSVSFAISNPNSFTATISKLEAHVYDNDANSNVDIGRGTITDKQIKANANTTIAFPFQIVYDPAKDTNRAILKDIASKCSSSGQNLDFTLKVDVRLSIVSVAIPFTISRPLSFACPDAIAQIVSATGNLGTLVSSLTSKRRQLGARAQELADLAMRELTLELEGDEAMRLARRREQRRTLAAAASGVFDELQSRDWPGLKQRVRRMAQSEAL